MAVADVLIAMKRPARKSIRRPSGVLRTADISFLQVLDDPLPVFRRSQILCGGVSFRCHVSLHMLGVAAI
jgi:hypothetical protein